MRLLIKEKTVDSVNNQRKIKNQRVRNVKIQERTNKVMKIVIILVF